METKSNKTTLKEFLRDTRKLCDAASEGPWIYNRVWSQQRFEWIHIYTINNPPDGQDEEYGYNERLKCEARTLLPKYEKIVGEWEVKLNKIIAMAGNPDASEGCRLIMNEATQALKRVEEIIKEEG